MSEGIELGGDRALALLRQALRHKMIMILTSAAVFLIGSLIVFNLTPYYRASALLLLPSAPADDPRSSAAHVAQTDPFLIASELDVLSSEEVARAVIRELDLLRNPTFQKVSPISKLTGSLRALLDLTPRAHSGSQAGSAPWTEAEYKMDSVLGTYMHGLSTYNDGRSTTAYVSFTSPDPQLAKEIVNAHVAAYINLQADRRVRAQQRVVDLLTAELDQRQLDLKQAELDLAQFRAKAPTNEDGATEETPAFEASEEVRFVRAVNTAQADISQTSARLDEASQALKSGILQSASFVANDAKLVSPATVPTRKIYPKTTLFLLSVLALSLGCGAGAALAVDYARNGSRRFHSSLRNMGLETLGSVPLARTMLGMGRLNAARAVEQMRFVREALLKRVRPEGLVVLVTSAMPREGKSSIAVQLAESIAATGRRTLLIDADLRMARASAMLGQADKDCAGLSDVLADSADCVDAIEYIEAKNIHLLGAGSSADTVDALSSRHIIDLAERLRGGFEAIVIDSPPLVAVADAVSLAAVADTALLVVRVNRTPVALVEKSVALMRACHISLAGCVLTGVTGQDSDQLAPHDRKRYSVNSRSRKKTALQPTIEEVTVAEGGEAGEGNNEQQVTA